MGIRLLPSQIPDGWLAGFVHFHTAFGYPPEHRASPQELMAEAAALGGDFVFCAGDHGSEYGPDGYSGRENAATLNHSGWCRSHGHPDPFAVPWLARVHYQELFNKMQDHLSAHQRRPHAGGPLRGLARAPQRLRSRFAGSREDRTASSTEAPPHGRAARNSLRCGELFRPHHSAGRNPAIRADRLCRRAGAAGSFRATVAR